MQAEQLAGAAEAAAKHAYAPYSRFYVGAAILLATGETVTGCNVENASYRLTTCAEQTAISCAVATYGPGIRVLAVAVHNLASVACQPCGACRQTIAEFAAADAVIIFPGPGGRRDTCTLEHLLPSSFKLESA